MASLEEKISPEKVFEHITNLSNSKAYENRLDYIVRFLETQGLKQKNEAEEKSPSYYIQTIPKKWQKIKGVTAKNIVVTIPGETNKTNIWISHNDTTQGFESFLRLFKHKPKKEKLQYGANDNGSGCAVLMEDIKNSYSKKPKNTQVYLFSGLEEGMGSRSIWYSLLSGTGLISLTSASFIAASGLLNSMPLKSIANSIYHSSFEGLLLLAIPFVFTKFKPLDRFRLGVIGSKHYADTLDKKILSYIDSAITVDMVAGKEYVVPKSCIGIEPLRWIFPRKSDKKLNRTIKDCIYELEGKFTEYTIGSSDHVAFHERGLPSAAIFTNVKNILTDVHTTKDNPENINLETLAKSCDLIPLVKKRLNGEKKYDLKKKGDLATLFYEKNTKEKYVLLTNLEKDIPLNQLYRVEEKKGKYEVKEFVDWTADLEVKHLGRNNSLKLKKLKPQEFVISDNNNDTRYEQPIYSEKVKGNLVKAYGRWQGTLAEHLIPALFTTYASVGIAANMVFGPLGLAESLALLPVNLSIAFMALKDYNNIVTQAYKHTSEGTLKGMYSPK
ncbi:MAG: M28 family peptidase [Nanoarchaeota archaeon]|nr:M28 family peptidase [Nanoarchaeota archaeon]